jgi:hypothetical protein
MRTEKILRLAVAAAVGLSGSTVVSAGAAADPVALCSAPARVGDINRATAPLLQSGEDQATLDAFVAKEFGLIRVSREIPGPVSTPGALSLPAPSIYRDSCSSRYTAFATWSWRGLSHLRNETGCSFDFTCDIGGYEAFGMAFSRSVADPGGHSLLTWGANGLFPVSSTRAYADEAHPMGVAYKGQDKFKAAGACCSADYSFYAGQMVYGIDAPGCGHLTVFSKFGHSWSSSNLNSISVSHNAVSITFSNTSLSWNLASQASNTVIPC